MSHIFHCQFDISLLIINIFCTEAKFSFSRCVFQKDITLLYVTSSACQEDLIDISALLSDSNIWNPMAPIRVLRLLGRQLLSLGGRQRPSEN